MNIKDLVKAAEEQGWEVEITQKSHLKFIPPEKNKRIVICSGTPGGRCAVRNALSDLRRSGLVWAQRGG